MAESNMSGFIFLGFPNILGSQNVLFALFLCMYLVTLLSNVTIIFVINTSSSFEPPMYFFLGHLSFLDLCYISVTVPKTLSNFLEEVKGISLPGCIIQLLLFISMEGTEAFLLAVMAYDRYLAICSPMHYPVIMNGSLCLCLVAASWISGMLNSLVHTALTFNLPFCATHELNHFFCDIPPLLHISCKDTYVNELVLFLVGGMWVGFGPFLFIIISYTYIISTILKIPSPEGRHKVFSTCASHFIVVVLFYGTAIFTYIRPSSTYSLERDSMVSVLYSVVTPMLNPIIYSLRNKEIKRVIIKTFYHVICCIHSHQM
ncbi:olfactory receptor 5V1-like [Discoglossus pictus]